MIFYIYNLLNHAMKYKHLIITGLLGMLCSCHTNSIIGRSQLNLVSESEVQAMAFTQYKDFLSTNKVVSTGNANADMVKRVGNRIAGAITRYYAEHGETETLK